MVRTLAVLSYVREEAKAWGRARKDSDGPGTAGEADGRDGLRRSEVEERGVKAKAHIHSCGVPSVVVAVVLRDSRALGCRCAAYCRHSHSVVVHIPRTIPGHCARCVGAQSALEGRLLSEEDAHEARTSDRGIRQVEELEGQAVERSTETAVAQEMAGSQLS